MTLEDDIKALGKHESFLRVLNFIHQYREHAIGGIYNLSGNELLRASGEIKALDELLIMLQYDKVLEKWNNLM